MVTCKGRASKLMSALPPKAHIERLSQKSAHCSLFAAEYPFMDLTNVFPRWLAKGGDKRETTSMRKAILGAASALALASPVVAADLPVQPRFTEFQAMGRNSNVRVPSRTARRYRRAGSPRFRDRRGSPACHCGAAASGSREYPVYRFYAAPHAYAYAAPVWRDGWRHRRHFHGHW